MIASLKAKHLAVCSSELYSYLLKQDQDGKTSAMTSEMLLLCNLAKKEKEESIDQHNLGLQNLKQCHLNSCYQNKDVWP